MESFNFYLNSLNGYLNNVTFTEALWVVALVAISVTLFALMTGFAQEKMAKAKGMIIYDVPLFEGQLKHEAIGTMVFLTLFIPSTALSWAHVWQVRSGWIPNIVTLLVCWHGFQIYYYFLHRAMHSKALYRFHKWHHRSRVVTPLAGYSMHPVEAIGWVAGMLVPSLVLSYAGMLGSIGLLTFFFFHFSGNINGHCNGEFMPAFFGNKTVAFIAGVPLVYHGLHHGRYEGHYGFGNGACDRMGGTEFSDWQQVHQQVLAGTPMTRLGERIKTSDT